MRHPLRAIVLGCALALTPACASIGQPPVANPVAAAKTLDQRAYALLRTYAALVEEATDIVGDPATPRAVSRALGQAERIATPAAETLTIAVGAYLRAQADFNALSGQSQPALERASLALTIAAQGLNQAIAAAQAPIGELEHHVRAGRG
jgi:hypothetical protein